jgi:hypothetical protein
MGVGWRSSLPIWMVTETAAAQMSPSFDDNADSIAVVIGNSMYKQTVAVDFAHNVADAIHKYLVRVLGLREANVQ